MDSSMTPNTNTNSNNTYFTNSTNSNNPYSQEKKQTVIPEEQIQYFSHILEAFTFFINELNTPDMAYKLLLALLAYTGKRTSFFAKQETLYQLIHNYKDPSSVKKVNEGSARKFVWRHVSETESWMNQIGITLFTKTIPPKAKKGEKQNATEYNILPLITVLIEIIKEAYATRHLFKKYNIGEAIKTAAIKKAQELKESATPNPSNNPKTIKKELSDIKKLENSIKLTQRDLLRLKNSELSKQTDKHLIAAQIEASLQPLLNLSQNILLSLRQPSQTNSELSENDDFCPTYENHILYMPSTSVPDMSPIPSDFSIEEGFLSQDDEFLVDEQSHLELSSLECETNLSPIPLQQEQEQVLINEEITEKFTITLFENHFEDVGTEATVSLEEFVDCIGMDNPVVITPKSDSKEDILAAKQKNKGFCPAVFVSDEEGRSNNNVDCLSMICFDFDHADLKIDVPAILVLGFCAFLYTSYCHNKDNHRFRLGFLLDKPIDSKYYPLIWTKLFSILRREVGKEGTKVILNIDESCHNTSRLWYLPAIQNKDSEYFYKLFTKQDGYKLLNWEEFIADEIRLFDLGIEESDSFPSLQTQQQNNLVEQTVAEIYKKNVTLFSSEARTYVSGTDKPFINGYYWPSYLRALEEKAGDVSLADSSWSFYCAKAGIPMEIAILGLLEVSPKASVRVNKSYGKGLYYHIETVKRAYKFYFDEFVKK